MAQFACQCLNVTINSLSSEIESIAQLGITMTDPFFQNNLSITNLDKKGIVIAQNNLCKSRQTGKYIINSCLNCKLDTHAFYEENETVYVNLSLERDAAKIQSLKETENYSKLFKIILPVVDNIKKSVLDLKLQSKSCQLDTVFQSIKQQATNYLCAEQKEMDERIRVFTEQQYTDYNNLQTRILSERQTLIDLLAQLHSQNAHKITLPVSLASFPSPPTSPDNSEYTPSSEYAFEKSETQHDAPKAVVKVSTSLLAANIRQFSKMENGNACEMQSSMRFKKSRDTAAIFDMDGLDEDESPFPLSDDEADTDDSTTDDLSIGIRRENDQLQRQAYATSLPISVPLWSAMNHPELSDDDDKNPTPDPQQIAASIKAIALSIRDDKEMFGDLPRRRLNTGDLVKSRPI